MFDRFTDRSRLTMALARKEAQRYDHDFIGTEHILLGLVEGGEEDGCGVAAHVLRDLGVDLYKVRREIEKNIQRGPSPVTMGQLPFTPRAKKVLEFAMEEADKLRHDHIGTEHLLLGLLRERVGMAAQVLGSLGVTVEAARKGVLEILGVKDVAAQADSAGAGHAGGATFLARLGLRMERALGGIEVYDRWGRAVLRIALDDDGEPCVWSLDERGDEETFFRLREP